MCLLIYYTFYIAHKWLHREESVLLRSIGLECRDLNRRQTTINIFFFFFWKNEIEFFFQLQLGNNGISTIWLRLVGHVLCTKVEFWNVCAFLCTLRSSVWRKWCFRVEVTVADLIQAAKNKLSKHPKLAAPGCSFISLYRNCGTFIHTQCNKSNRERKRHEEKKVNLIKMCLSISVKMLHNWWSFSYWHCLYDGLLPLCLSSIAKQNTDMQHKRNSMRWKRRNSKQNSENSKLPMEIKTTEILVFLSAPARFWFASLIYYITENIVSVDHNQIFITFANDLIIYPQML